MNAQFSELILNMAVQLPIAGAALWLYYREREHGKERERNHDEDTKAITKDLIVAYQKNAEVNQAVKDAVENNTSAVKELCTTIVTSLISSRGKKGG